MNRPRDVARAFRFERGGLCRTAGAELDPDLWLRLQAGFLHTLDQAQPIVCGQGDESAGNLNDVEAAVAALADVTVHHVRALAQDAFDEPTRGYKHVGLMAPVDDLDQR